MAGELPLAVRRGRRSLAHQADQKSTASRASERSSAQSHSCTVETPIRKKVRFSDPGPVDNEPSTGLTPMIRRTSLSSKSTKQRRSTPARPKPASCYGSGAISFADVHSPGAPFSGEVRLLPLRQVLDGRVVRRIRRNGLSEEMNSLAAERRRETRAEIARLTAEVDDKNAEICRLRNDKATAGNMAELEQQVEALKRQLDNRSSIVASSPNYDWTFAARDPFSDDYTERNLTTADNDVDEEFGNTTIADLMCSTPSRKARNSFPTPPTTSPAGAPMTPCSYRSTAEAMLTPRSDSGVQASLPDPEKEQLEDELASLQLEICKLTTTLETYRGLESRLAEQLEPFASNSTANTEDGAIQSAGSEIEKHIKQLLQTLSDRTAALLSLNDSLSSLGFPGNDASEIVASLSAAFRSARLELEYLTPGEITLPLTAAGAAVLDLLLDRLRDLARRGRETDDAIDEYHELEASLRSQLGARVTAMDGLARENAAQAAALSQRDARVAELEVGLERQKGAAASYERDVAELERLVERLEAERAAKVTELEDRLTDAEKRAAEQDVANTASHAEVEGRLAAAEQRAADQLDAHVAERTKLNTAHGRALALRDARVAELRGEIERVNAALRAAHDAVAGLRVEAGRLRRDKAALEAERDGLLASREEDCAKAAREAVEAVRAELRHVGEGLLAGTPRKRRQKDSGIGLEEEEVDLVNTPTEARRGSLLAGDLAKKGLGSEKTKGKGKKRRRYDSGLGFLDEQEIEVGA